MPVCFLGLCQLTPYSKRGWCKKDMTVSMLYTLGRDDFKIPHTRQLITHDMLLPSNRGLGPGWALAVPKDKTLSTNICQPKRANDHIFSQTG